MDLAPISFTFFFLLAVIAPTVNSNYDTSMVHRLLEDRDLLIQDGLSYFNGTTLKDVVANNHGGHEVRCVISIENWTRWMLGFPVVYTNYGDFQFGFHEREVFAAHREIVVAVNDLDSITGSSGVVAWELGDKNIHLILMWSVPYNLNFFNAHFGFGMVHLSTKFTRDMLPYWYRRMYEGDPGSFKRGMAGQSLVYKHHDVFILGHLEKDTYSPVLNISVMPWSTKNLAPSIWHQLYLQTSREEEAQPFSSAGNLKMSPICLLVAALVASMHTCFLSSLYCDGRGGKSRGMKAERSTQKDVKAIQGPLGTRVVSLPSCAQCDDSSFEGSISSLQDSF